MIYIDRYLMFEASSPRTPRSIYRGELWSIPVKLLEKKKNRIAYKLLEFINRFGKEGVKVGEIKKYLIENLHGKKYDPVKDRGYWNTSLYGYNNVRGLFDYYCEKVPGSLKWRLNDETLAFFETEPESLVKYSQHSKERVRQIAQRNPNFPKDLEGWAISADDWN